jgi:ABC-type branched-subunit amino acid transport system ATPase component
MNQTETAEVLEQLIAIKQTGQAMLIVEHKIDFVVALADRVLVLDGGRIIAEGTPAEVRDDPVVVEAYLGRPRERLSIIDPASVKNDSESTLLNLDSLRVDYGPVRALDDISLSVGKGEIVSLLGGNASGKSTTMKTILGLLKPSAGRITWDGTDITGASTAQRVRGGIASVPEARRIFPDMTVEENLLVGAYTRKNRREIAEDLDWIYELFPRLAERRRQHAGTFSGGEQQMLAFGRALISRPRLICMDEPTMGLSPRLVDQVLAQIAELNARSGVAVLIVEQQAELALSIAARGYVLASGRLVASGSAADLLADSKIQEAYLGRG